jgi:hypothetical protein
MSILDNYWTLWFHKIDDNNWDKDSYIKILKFNTLEEYFDLIKQIKDFTYGMFYLMKDDIFPAWEDSNNINGGYWSFKIYKINSNDAWIQLSYVLLGNTLCKNTDFFKHINGISISPKYSNCIIKILNNDYTQNDTNLLNNDLGPLNLEQCIYKKYQELDNFNKK